MSSRTRVCSVTLPAPLSAAPGPADPVAAPAAAPAAPDVVPAAPAAASIAPPSSAAVPAALEAPSAIPSAVLTLPPWLAAPAAPAPRCTAPSAVLVSPCPALLAHCRGAGSSVARDASHPMRSPGSPRVLETPHSVTACSYRSHAEGRRQLSSSSGQERGSGVSGFRVQGWVHVHVYVCV